MLLLPLPVIHLLPLNKITFQSATPTLLILHLDLALALHLDLHLDLVLPHLVALLTPGEAAVTAAAVVAPGMVEMAATPGETTSLKRLSLSLLMTLLAGITEAAAVPTAVDGTVDGTSE